jgi:uncharacterized protein YyaL (SSP411 family)
MPGMMPEMANRLAGETSPYLQQHARNPVDWYPWGPEALERARTENKPILLSIGYSACHWCHVMAQESFEDPQVAALMNRDFVNVKVDREERPDLDQVYQVAHQMLAQGSGGWPLTMFLSPDGTPFLGGTYFPKTARYGRPGFAELLQHVARLWRERRAEIREQDERVKLAFSSLEPAAPGSPRMLDASPMDGALEALRANFDPRFGGFGGAPKFPHPTDLELCLRAHARRGDRGALEMAVRTLEGMCEGGIYDHLGGGFCRYSVDAEWSIPHFEKMLYDNALLVVPLAQAWLVTRNPLFERCVAETAAWLMREMQSPEGGYYSSLDADSEHEEGKFYVWSRQEVQDALEPDEWQVAANHWGLDQPANFEGRHWHLRVRRPLEPQAAHLLSSARQKLLRRRDRRVRPGRDEKVLVSWNALAIRAMAFAGRVFDRADWIDSARRALEHLRSRMWRNGRLLATYKDRRAQLAAYLDDYAFLLAALLELLQCEFSMRELRFAIELADVLLEQFEDPLAGGFYFTAHDHERLLHRPKPGHDGAMPAGNGMAAFALNRLSALTGDERYARAAGKTLELFHPAIERQPAGCATLLQALDETVLPPSTLVLRGKAQAVRSWAREMAQEFLPDALIVPVPDGLPGLPAILDKPLRPAAVTGWLCRGPVCLEPIDDLEALRHACRERAPVV